MGAGGCRMVLNSPSFYNFFSWVEAKEFEVASDAFATFKVRSKARREAWGGRKLLFPQSHQEWPSFVAAGSLWHRHISPLCARAPLIEQGKGTIR